MKNYLLSLFLLIASAGGETVWSATAGNLSPLQREIPAKILHDKIRGGLLGQLLGDLNGLKHEMKYIDEPGNVQQYTPALPDGAWTDDDTDFEWVYLIAMQERGQLELPYDQIAQLWKTHINRMIWCANQYARQLMDIGLEPPLTGKSFFNPWASFNISGQFLSESFALIAPGMPQTAARLGLHYTQVAISEEPAQATQLFDVMIAAAFFTNELQQILDAGIAALDEHSEIRQILRDVRAWWQDHPLDWRLTRRLVKQKYSRHEGNMRDRNGYELNTASVIAALLYGDGDFIKTLMMAFNFGWDADNNAATAGTILGVIKGVRWMEDQGWNIQDRYRNTSRDQMPSDETISRFGDRLIELADRVISSRGGSKRIVNGESIYRVPCEQPICVARLSGTATEFAEQKRRWKGTLDQMIGLERESRALARAAYIAIALDLAVVMREKHPDQWNRALEALNQYPKVVQVLFFESPEAEGAQLRSRALTAGLKKPPKREKIW